MDGGCVVHHLHRCGDLSRTTPVTQNNMVAPQPQGAIGFDGGIAVNAGTDRNHIVHEFDKNALLLTPLSVQILVPDPQRAVRADDGDDTAHADGGGRLH